MTMSMPISTIEFAREITGPRPNVSPSWADFSRPMISPDDDRVSGWNKVIRNLHTMLTLEDDWDGMGASAPSTDVIISAIELAYALRSVDGYPAPTRVVPTPSGTVGLEWQGSSTYTEAEIVAPYRSEWMQIREGGEPEHWTLDGIPDTDFIPGLASTASGTVGPGVQYLSAYLGAESILTPTGLETLIRTASLILGRDRRSRPPDRPA